MLWSIKKGTCSSHLWWLSDYTACEGGGGGAWYQSLQSHIKAGNWSRSKLKISIILYFIELYGLGRNTLFIIVYIFYSRRIRFIIDIMRLDQNTKLEIVRLYQQKLRISEIRTVLETRGIKTSWQTVRNCVDKYVTGELESSNHEEVKMICFDKLSSADTDAIEKAYGTNPARSSTDVRDILHDRGIDVSKSTAKKAINAAGFTYSTPRYCSMIRDKNKEKRIEFCRDLIEANDDLGDIIFTDECTVQMHGNKVIVYRPRDAAAVHIPTPKHSLKLHVWAGISKRGSTRILLFDGILRKEFYCEEILQNTLCPFIQEVYPDHHRFQQDNDPKHTSNMAKEFMKNHGINSLKWPSESCDLNPIEMVWNQMKTFIGKRKPRVKEALEQAIYDFWETKMDEETCCRYIDHIFKVAPIVVKMKGQSTGDFPGRIFSEPSRGKSFQYFMQKLQEPEIAQRAQILLQ